MSIHAGRAECSASSEARAGGQEQGFGDTTKNGNGLACSATLDFDSAISMWPCQYFLSILWQVHTKNISQLSTMAKVVQRQLMAVRGIRAFHSWFVQYMHPSMKQFSEACTRFPQRNLNGLSFLSVLSACRHCSTPGSSQRLSIGTLMFSKAIDRPSSG